MDVSREELFVPDYDDYVDVGTEIIKKRNRNGLQCNLCDVKSKYPQKHAYGHFPIQFNPSQNKDLNPSFVVINSLLKISTYFNVNSIFALHSLVLENKWYPTQVENTKLTEIAISMFDNLSEKLQIPKVEYSLNPPNSIVLLAHWKILSMILQHTDSTFRALFCQTALYDFSISDSAFISDSHFHLNQLLKRRQCDEFFETINSSQYPVALAIDNICFYKLPTVEYIENVHSGDDRIFFTLGAHPRFPESGSDLFFNKVRQLANHPLVVGIGEVGFDSTGCTNDISQNVVFEKMVTIAKSCGKTLVLHCRENDGHSQFLNLLHVLEQMLPKYHSIHLHCYTYGVEMMDRWLKIFPNTSFGITSVLLRNLDVHIMFLKSVNLHQMVVESDSPYLDKRKSSLVIVELVKCISELRNLSIEFLLTLMFENTKRLYKINM